MKKSELFFSFLLVPIDFLMIVLAGITAYYLRFTEFFQGIRPVVFEFEFAPYLEAVFLIALLWLFIFAFSGLYAIRTARKLINETYRVVLACSTGLTAVVILIFFQRELFDSRFIILAGWILAIVYVSFGRGLIRGLQRLLFFHGIGVRNAILVGASKTADSLMNKFSADKSFGFRIVKRVKDFSVETACELEDYLKSHEIDEIIQSDPNLSKKEVLKLYDFTDEHHLTFKYVADLLDAKVLKTEVMELSGIPVVEVKKTSLDGWGRIVKRIFDIVFSTILILFFSPIIIIAAIAVKLDSHGPIFFSQKDDGTPLRRVGQGGKLFNYFKFRSMLDKTDSMRYKELADRDVRQDGPLVKIKDDPRVTRVGRFIRRFSIDELPELFLVFSGEMSLVGPRPHLPEEVAKYELHHKKVLTIKPGITGLAQISGRSDLSFEEEVKLDTYYIENWSFFFDLAILLRTPIAVLRSRQSE